MLWRSRSIRLFGEEGMLRSASCFQMIQSGPVHCRAPKTMIH
jgi:hypothetical protein